MGYEVNTPAANASRIEGSQEEAIRQMHRTRAVARRVGQRATLHCVGCETPIIFRANPASIRKYGANVVVVCNVYDEGTWQKTEVFHPDCYDSSGEPYGEVLDAPPIEPTPQEYMPGRGKPATHLPRGEVQHHEQPAELAQEA